MKPTCLILFISTLLLGCTSKSPYEIIKHNVVNYTIDSLKAKKYELIELKLVDSITYKNNIDRDKELVNYALKHWQQQLDNTLENYKYAKPQVIEDKTSLIIANINQIQRIQFKIDSIETSNEQLLYTSAAYLLMYKYKEQSSFGEPIKHTCYVSTTGYPGYSVLNVQEDLYDLMHLSQKHYPGSDEIKTLITLP